MSKEIYKSGKHPNSHLPQCGFQKGHKGYSHWKGKKRSNEFREKCRQNKKGKHSFRKNTMGKVKNGQGYIYIFNPVHLFANNCGYVFEHRLVIEQQIGRYLTLKEIGHHLGERDDNRPCMLMAFVNHSAHRRFHHNPENVKPSEIIFDGRKYLKN